MPMFYNKRDSEKIIIEPDHGVPLCNCCTEQVGSMVVLQGGVSGLSRVHFSRVCKAFVDYEIMEGQKLCLRFGAPYDGISLYSFKFVSQIYPFIRKYMFILRLK